MSSDSTNQPPRRWLHIDAALQYASIGWKVFPCKQKGKEPLTKHGCRDATVDAKQIEKWWKKWPHANIGVACGPNSGAGGLYVADIDVKDNASGFDSIKDLDIPGTLRQETPSGGAHLFFSSPLAPANKNSFLPGVDIRGDGYYVILAPSVHPNGKLYSWASEKPWDIVPVLFPDCLRPEAHIKEATETVQRRQKLTSDVETRAIKYLRQCDPAVQGQCGHNKLLWAASAMIHGFLLSEADTMRLLLGHYNPRCEPPWNMRSPKDHRDFARKVGQATANPPNQPQGWLLNELDSIDLASLPTIPDSVVDQWIEDSTVSVLGSTHLELPAEKVAASPEPVWEAPKKDELGDSGILIPPGVTGDMCKWINNTALVYQPLLSVAAVLAFYGALLGQKLAGPRNMRTNIYCMGVGDSSCGKQHGVTLIRNLCSLAGCSGILGGSNFASASSIEVMLARDPVQFCPCDEIGFLLKDANAIGSSRAGIRPVLMTLYSSSGTTYISQEYATQEPRKLVQPCLSLYGTTAPDGFYESLDQASISNGWLSRCLVFKAGYPHIKRWEVDGEVGPSQHIVENVRKWFKAKVLRHADASDLKRISEIEDTELINLGPKPRRASLTDSALKVFRDFDRDCCKAAVMHEAYAPLWLKAVENAFRIATIVCGGVSFENPTIDTVVAEYACNLVRYLLQNVGEDCSANVAENPVMKQKQKLLRIIHAAGRKGVALMPLSRKSQWLTAGQRKDILLDLEQSGLITTQKIKGKGRPTLQIVHQEFALEGIDEQ